MRNVFIFCKSSLLSKFHDLGTVLDSWLLGTLPCPRWLRTRPKSPRARNVRTSNAAMYHSHDSFPTTVSSSAGGCELQPSSTASGMPTVAGTVVPPGYPPGKDEPKMADDTAEFHRV